jgi:cytochrome P450
VATIPAHIPRERVFEFDIYFDPRLGEDLHDSYATLHRDAPDVFWTPANGGHWVVSRYDDILEIVKDPEHFSAREMQIPRVPKPPVFIPLSLDPPENIPYRKALMPYFQPKALARLQPRLRAFARELVAEVAAAGRCDFVHEIAARYPVSVFMELMGMPLEKLRDFRALAEEFFNARSGEDVERLSARIIGTMTELVLLRQREPGDDLISQMVRFEIEGRRIQLEELQSMLFVMFLGGMDTVTNVSSYAFRHLATDAPLQARLRADAPLIPKFVEESLRCFGVVNTPRIVSSDCEKLGVSFKAGEMVLCLLPLAGRDDRHHRDPNRFDVDRASHDHLTFSAATHYCPGAHLARMEMSALTEAWLERIPSFSQVPGVVHKSRAGTVMALESLPLQW